LQSDSDRPVVYAGDAQEGDNERAEVVRLFCLRISERIVALTTGPTSCVHGIVVGAGLRLRLRASPLVLPLPAAAVRGGVGVEPDQCGVIREVYVSAPLDLLAFTGDHISVSDRLSC